jgi:diphosphomevalonate decarboxylase
MTHVQAIAHPNIALIKYWGKRSIDLNLPAVSSLSMTLDRYRTTTRVRWGAPQDRVILDGVPAPTAFASRVLAHLDRIDPRRPPVEVDTTNDFPTAAGLASSASGFAALTVAALTASGQPWTVDHASRIARQGSGSACRSLWGGLVVWRRGSRDDGLDSHGEPIDALADWDLRMVVAVVRKTPKLVGSTEAMERSRLTSPYYPAWVETSEADVDAAVAAVRGRDLQRLGELMEASTLKMHATMHTSRPPVVYWRPETLDAMHAVAELRARGIGAWFTMDAGPNVKVLTSAQDAPTVEEALRPLVTSIDVLGPGGAPVVERL